MAYTRSNVDTLGGDWADPILWYARGVGAMQARALADRTSWRFFGAIHGFDQPQWRRLGYLTTGAAPPPKADVDQFWNQCQHGSWYFVPWHRGYLLAFEATVRAAIKSLGGPADTWALPYWNYFGPNQNALPAAFASPDWPDGKGDNPLHTPARYGPDDNPSNIYVPLDAVNLDALTQSPDFDGSLGFGGAVTGFSHGGQTHGAVESQPHDQVHGLVGGGDQQTLGLMSWPDLAGLDPIFWLHHANIDRLWEVWRGVASNHGDPADADWTKGPANSGGRAFQLPMPDGTVWTYAPGDMEDLAKLGYAYDDATPPAQVQPLAARLALLGAPPAVAAAIERRAAMPTPRTEELVGASDARLRLVGSEGRAQVMLHPEVQRRVVASLAAASPEAPAPDRVFLKLEGVKGLNDAIQLKVYVGLPEGADPAQHDENLAGSVGLFGVSKASRADGPHAGAGVTFVLDISRIVDGLHLSGALDAGKLDVRLVPRRPIDEGDQISVGQISVYRQGG